MSKPDNEKKEPSPNKMIDWFMRYKDLFKKLLMLVCTILLIIVMFPQKQRGTHYDYSVGSFWKDSDLYAPYDFQILKSEDAISREVAAAKSKSMLYYTVDSSAHPMALQRLADMRQRLRPGEYAALRYEVDTLYRRGVIEVTADFPDIDDHTIVLLSGNVGSEHSPAEFVQLRDVDNALLADSVLVPNIVIDEVRTQLELDSRLSQLDYASHSVGKGELIVSKGEHITAEKAEVLASLEAENDRRFVDQFNPFVHYFGRFMLCAIAFVALIMFLSVTRHPIIYDNYKLALVLFTILLMTGCMAAVLHWNSSLTLLVPLCIGPILMHTFFGMRAALYIHITTIIILGHMVPDSFEFIFYQLIAGMMSIISVRDFERRSRFFIVSLVIFFTYSLIYTCGILWQDTNLHNINPQRYYVFFFNAVLTLLAQPLIYLFEKMSGITTNLTLSEIANTNTPALRELSRKAPGTFQHCMQVANLSEDIINEIGGNPLLAKVGALYHDIGKVRAPIYFTENQNSGYNPHVELPYEESAALIIRHVTDGVELAHKYHLPDDVTAFIRTHHGTTFTGYFYNKYLEEHPGEVIDKSKFRYSGPMPYTRETAVVMLVDSVEAACKSLKEHDKEHIDKLVDSIVFGKIEAGQMSQCNLTFADISAIRKMLKNKLLSIYHARISYPVVKKQ